MAAPTWSDVLADGDDENMAEGDAAFEPATEHDDPVADADDDDGEGGPEAGAEADADEQESAVEDGRVDDASEPPPPKPKRSTSAWSFYLAKCHGNRLSKEASEQWKALEEEAKAEFIEQASKDKERYEQEKVAYEADYAAWSTKYPDAVAALATAAKTSGDALDPAVAYLPLARVRKLARMNDQVKTVSKEALFAIVKSAESLVQMLTEQSAVAARKAKRKSVTTIDLAAVVYGSRCADLMHYCHADMPQKDLLAAGAPKKKPKPAVVSPTTVAANRKEAADGEAGGLEMGLEGYFGRAADGEGGGEGGEAGDGEESGRDLASQQASTVGGAAGSSRAHTGKTKGKTKGKEKGKGRLGLGL